MLRTTWRTARATAARLVAAGLAIALGTGFVTAVLLATDLLQRTVYAAVSTSYRGADVVVDSAGTASSAADLARVRTLPGVAGADGTLTSGVELATPSGPRFVEVASTPHVPVLRPRGLVAGHLPRAAGQVALSATAATQVGAHVGDGLAARVVQASTEVDGVPATREVRLRVVGLVDDPRAGAFSSSPDAWGWPADVQDWVAHQSDPAATSPTYEQLLVVARAGTDPDQLRTAVAGVVHDPGARVRTADEESAAAVDRFGGRLGFLSGILLAFAALSLFVAGIVITNTFAVLVAQRTRQLALLRCVGATTGQVRRSVLAEALVLGGLASAVGVGLGAGLAALAVVVLHRVVSGIPVPATIHLGPVAALVPLVLGAAVTVLAALAPARAATRVSPLAALRPAAAPDLRTSGSRVRLAVSVLLVVLGAAMLAGGVALAALGSSAGILVALPGGALSFLGVMIGAVFLVPRLVGVSGRALGVVASRLPGRGGASTRVATANAVRNPRRTAATASALLIGVTLVSLMTVGAACTRATLEGALDDAYPVDVAVEGQTPGIADLSGADATSRADALAAHEDPLPTGARAAVAGADGVGSVLSLRSARVVVTVPAGEGSSTPATSRSAAVSAYGVDPRVGARVLRSRSLAGAVRPGRVVLSPFYASTLRVRAGEEVRLDAGARSATAVVAIAPTGGDAVLVTAPDLAALAPEAAVTRVWASLAPDADPAATLDRVQRAITSATPDGAPAPQVTGAAVQRAAYERVISTMLLVVVALLAVAVVIALVGVANTLSLSVIERTRESAVLRALGMTRGQLRASLAVEGALLTGVGGLLGVLLGSAYGWAGAAALLGRASGGGVVLALPWGQLALVVAIALAAGLLASVLPARRAVATPPVAALAEA